MAKKTKAVKRVEDIKEFDLIDEKIIDNGTGENDETSPEPVKAKKISPFDIIGMMFNDHKTFDSLTDSVLNQNFFMINRTFAIKYPFQAAYFNHLNVNMAETLKFWKYFLNLKEGTGRTPQFVYTKGAKRASDEAVKTKADKFDKQLICDYCKRYSLSLKDFNDMLQFFNEETVADVKRFEKLMSKSGQNEQYEQFKNPKKKK